MTEAPWWEDDPERPTAEYEPPPKPEKKAKAKPLERLATTPRTWSECLERFAYVLGGHSEECNAAAQEWVAQAVHACWGERSLFDVTRQRRQIALQRTVGTVLWLEDQGEIAFALNVRALVQQAFARYWNGVALDGPQWRMTPIESLPLYAEISAGAEAVTVP